MAGSTWPSLVSQPLLPRGCSHLTSGQSQVCAPVLPRGAKRRAPAPRPELPLPLGSPGAEPRVLHGSHLEMGVFSFPLRVGIWEGKESKFHFLDYKFVFLNIVSFL